jgi:undecaprenyl-diphosphatase
VDLSIQALIMGLVQGLTEFIPVSSSGHLILVPWAVRLEGSVHRLGSRSA